MPKALTRYKWIAVLLPPIILIALAYIISQMFLSTLYVEKFGTGSLRQTYNQEYKKLSRPFESLGIGSPTDTKSCNVLSTTYWVATSSCWISKHYPYTTDSASTPVLAAYHNRAAQLERLLAQNGWVNDSPAEYNESLVSIGPNPNNQPTLTSDGSTERTAHYYKNIGPITCSLRVDISSMNSLNAEYLCYQQFHVPGLYLKNYYAPGP